MTITPTSPDPVTFVLNLRHGEYQPEFPEGSIVATWSVDDGEELTPGEAVYLWAEMMGEPFPGDEMDAEDLAYYTWVKVTTTRFELAEAMVSFAGVIAGGPTGADDDTFDYWPSGARVLLAVAEILDRALDPDDGPTMVDVARDGIRLAARTSRPEFADEMIASAIGEVST